MNLHGAHKIYSISLAISQFPTGYVSTLVYFTLVSPFLKAVLVPSDKEKAGKEKSWGLPIFLLLQLCEESAQEGVKEWASGLPGSWGSLRGTGLGSLSPRTPGIVCKLYVLVGVHVGVCVCVCEGTERHSLTFLRFSKGSLAQKSLKATNHRHPPLEISFIQFLPWTAYGCELHVAQQYPCLVLTTVWTEWGKTSKSGKDITEENWSKELGKKIEVESWGEG